MKKHDDALFQIGEVVKLMGVTRKTLLVFENEVATSVCAGGSNSPPDCCI